MSDEELSQMLSYRVPDKLMMRLVKLAKRTGKSVSELCREFTEDGVRAHGSKAKKEVETQALYGKARAALQKAKGGDQ